MSFMKHLYHYIKAAIRLSRYHANLETIVWEDLKKYHQERKFNSGVYEAEKRIESLFSVADGQGLNFNYSVAKGNLHFRVNILTAYAPEIATDIFVLASHFNNVLNEGVVVVYPSHYCVEFHMKSDCVSNIIYPILIHDLLLIHFNTAKDIYWAFNKLVTEGEEPAIILADLFQMKEESDKQNK